MQSKKRWLGDYAFLMQMLQTDVYKTTILSFLYFEILISFVGFVKQ